MKSFNTQFSHFEEHIKSRLATKVIEYMAYKGWDKATFIDLCTEYNIKEAGISALEGEFFGTVGELVTLLLLIEDTPILID